MNDDKDKQTAQVIINNYIASAGDTAKCPHCGEVFTNEMLRDDKRVPTHDYPKPCRSVCPGSGQLPIPDETPLVNAIATALAAAGAESAKESFTQGYVCAVANILNTHDEEVIAWDVLQANMPDDWNIIDEVDRDTLKPMLDYRAEVERSKSSKSRAGAAAKEGEAGRDA